MDITAVATAAGANGIAQISSNNITLSAGSDTAAMANNLSVNVLANAGSGNSANVIGNAVTLLGVNGADVLTFSLNGTAATKVAYTSNAITLNGGSGNDTINLTIADADVAVGNNVTILGGAGDDTINLTLPSVASTESSNNMLIKGGAGADTIKFVDVGTVGATIQYTNAAALGDTIAGLGTGDFLGDTKLKFTTGTGANYFAGFTTATSGATRALITGAFTAGSYGNVTAAHNWWYDTAADKLWYNHDGFATTTNYAGATAGANMVAQFVNAAGTAATNVALNTTDIIFDAIPTPP